MIKVVRNNMDPVLELSIEGRVDRQDYEDIEPLIEGKSSTFGEVNLLIRMEHLPAVSMGAVIEDLKFGLSHLDDIGKIAVVGDSELMETLVNLESVLPSIEAKYFDTDELQRAREWLAA